ncbi:MAG TPA: hypothetical protein VNZ58_10595 [Thermomicrobiales bacterium]|nr:hypothetical protein [Thermomicrobiales bacterium]
MTINKSRIYTFTAAAAVLFVFFGIAFADKFFTGPFFDKESITGGTWLHWLMLILIPVAGYLQAEKLGDEDHLIELSASGGTEGQAEDPKLWRLIMGNSHFAILWLPFRFFLGSEWISAGEGKIRDAGWMKGGQSLLGYWNNAVAIPEADSGRRPAITYDWFRDFLNYMIDHEWYTWFAKLVAVGEFMIGLGLIVGALVGIAAFFGSLMNMSFMLAGTTSTNPVLFGMTVFLILGWKVAGYFGIDRWLLPALGTPWGRLDRDDAARTDTTTTVGGRPARSGI